MGAKNNNFIVTNLYVQFDGGGAVNEGIHTILIVHLQNWLRAAKVERSRVR
jgi:hypothetical protein